MKYNAGETDIKTEIYRVAKNLAHFVLYAFTSSNIDRFSNVFHYQN